MNNRTLFVAALSVYLGLLIVGAPPQVLAQQSAQITKQKAQPTILLSENDKEKSLTYLFRQLAEVINKSAGETGKTHFSFTSDVIKGKFINFQVLADEGSPEILKLLREITDKFDLKQLESFEGISSVRRIARDYIIDSTGITTTTTYNFESVGKAKDYADALGLAFVNSKKAGKNSGQIPVVDKYSVHSIKDQVFIVTRLPRAALDSLVKAGEKAN